MECKILSVFTTKFSFAPNHKHVFTFYNARIIVFKKHQKIEILQDAMCVSMCYFDRNLRQSDFNSGRLGNQPKSDILLNLYCKYQKVQHTFKMLF